MKRFIVIFILIGTMLYAQDKVVTNNKTSWNLGQARTIEKGRLELGIFLPLKYGITDTLEVSTFPLFDFILPNITLKKELLNKKKLSVSADFSLLYPTFGLSLVAKRKIAGLLPEHSKIPQILSTDMGAILTYEVNKYFIVTTKVSLNIPIIFTDVTKEEFPPIDMMLLYPRVASYQGAIVYNLSLDIDGNIFDRLFYTIDVDLYQSLITYNSHSEMPLNIESKLLLTWKHSDSFVIYLGTKFIWGNYPYGRANLSLVPLFDVAWAF